MAFARAQRLSENLDGWVIILNRSGEILGNVSIKVNPDLSSKDGLDRYFSGGANLITGNAAILAPHIIGAK